MLELLISGTPEEYLWYMIVNIGFFTAIVICLIFGITLAVNHFYITKGDARKINQASRKKRPIFAVSRPDGFTEIVVAKKILPQGVIRPEGKQYPPMVIPSPQPTQGSVDVDNRETFDPTKRLFEKKSILKSAGVPFWNASSRGMVAANSDSLAVLEYGPRESHSPAIRQFSLPFRINIEKTNKLGGNVKAIPEPENPKAAETTLVELVFPVDAKTAYEASQKVWDPNVQFALELDAEQTAIMRAKKNQQEKFWATFGIGLAMMIIGAALLGVTLFLGK